MTPKIMKALTFSEFGSPEVLHYQNLPTPELTKNEVLVEMKAIGLNYADIYRRKGNYHLEGSPPYINGYEGAGIVAKSNSSEYEVGDRVGFADVPFANAEYVAVPESKVIPIREGIDLSLAGSVLLQGLTAQFISMDSHKVQPDETVLIHAASGGVGQILTQLSVLQGGKVIGLTRSKDKREIILANNAEQAVILDENWKSRVMEITDGKGVDVAYDSVGSTLVDTFEVTRNRGHVVFYGMAGGDPKPVDPKMLMESSKTLTGGGLWTHLTSKEERRSRADQLFEWIINGDITLKDPVKFDLSDGAEAHRYLEEGKSSGKVLLIP